MTRTVREALRSGDASAWNDTSATRALEEACAAFTSAELTHLAGLIADEPERAAVLRRAARTDKRLIADLPDDALRRLEALNYRAPGGRDPLDTKLGALFDAQSAVWEQALAFQGGRPMGMFSDAGNVAATRMIDQVISQAMAGRLPAHNVNELVSQGIRQVARDGHREISDTAVREMLAEALVRAGVLSGYEDASF